MKIMNAVKESFKKEKGSLIVEATIVFPVMFLIVIFLIFWEIFTIKGAELKQSLRTQL